MPEVKADVQINLARLMSNHDFDDRALQQAQSAVQIFRSLARPDPVQLAAAEILLGDLLVKKGRHDEAEPYLRGALASLVAEALEADLATAAAKISLGRMLVRGPSLQEGLALLHEAASTTRISSDRGGRAQELSCDSQLQLGTAYQQLEDAARSFEHLNLAWRCAVEAWGHRDGRSLFAQRVRSQALFFIGRADEAIEQLQSVVQRSREDPRQIRILADAQLDLAVVYLRMGEFVRAKDAHAQACEIYANHRERMGHMLAACADLGEKLAAATE